MRDFTLVKYKQLLEAFVGAGYKFAALEEMGQMSDGARGIVLRHDVDLLAEQSLRTAEIENSMGLRASYYFRVVKESNRPEIIKQIVSLGHEIGYHYEDLTLAGGDIDKAFGLFCEHLEYFRGYYPVRTICMHGSPRSPYDSKDIWKRYDYRKLGIVAEPYLDVDYGKWFYLTDTGRRWDGWRYSVRDKIDCRQEEWERKGWVFHSTDDIISALSSGCIPDKVLMTTHPQRWTDNKVSWFEELVLQNVKNMVKQLIIK